MLLYRVSDVLGISVYIEDFAAPHKLDSLACKTIVRKLMKGCDCDVFQPKFLVFDWDLASREPQRQRIGFYACSDKQRDRLRSEHSSDVPCVPTTPHVTGYLLITSGSVSCNDSLLSSCLS
jgi:hypothetical protein